MAPRKKTTLVRCLSAIEDPRVGNGKRHDLVEVLVIAICAIFAEVQGFEDMAEWAQVKDSWLRRFLRLENGIPFHDTFNRIFPRAMAGQRLLDKLTRNLTEDVAPMLPAGVRWSDEDAIQAFERVYGPFRRAEKRGFASRNFRRR